MFVCLFQIDIDSKPNLQMFNESFDANTGADKNGSQIHKNQSETR